MNAFPYAIPLAAMVVAVLLLVIVLSVRRLSKRIVCPADEQPRQVVFTGDTLDPEAWKDVLSCGCPGEKPLVGSALKCDKACLGDTANSPMHDLKA